MQILDFSSDQISSANIKPQTILVNYSPNAENCLFKNFIEENLQMFGK